MARYRAPEMSFRVHMSVIALYGTGCSSWAAGPKAYFHQLVVF